MNIFYDKKSLNKNNIFLTIEESYIKPNIKLNTNPNNIYTLVMFDPDAVGGNRIHWLITNINKNDISSGLTLIKYKGPNPVKGSGIHHYIFCLLEHTSKISIKNHKFKSRFIELKDLFDIIQLNKLNSIISNIKYFVSENL